MKKPFSKLKIALLADDFTRLALGHECKIRNVTPWTYAAVLRYWKPDFLLVESAWHGRWKSWQYRVAAYPGHPKRSNTKLRQMLVLAKDLGIPCVFWCKEDGVHFERFIHSASLFDAIFTVDENSVPRYREVVGPDIPVHPLMFAVQPAIHHPNGKHSSPHAAGCFVGSYSRTIHPKRRERQEMLFHAARHVGLVVYDRNSNRKSGIYRYPHLPGVTVRRCVPHEHTAPVYAGHRFALNVNTIDDSPTMFSRRLLEIMASGGLAVSTPAVAIERHFRDLCHVVDSLEDAEALFGRLQHGWDRRDREMAREASVHVHEHHTWEKRLARVCEVALGG